MSDVRPFSEENGWEVGGEYVENDVSAHSGEERPAYDRLMVDAIEAAREAGVRVLSMEIPDRRGSVSQRAREDLPRQE